MNLRVAASIALCAMAYRSAPRACGEFAPQREHREQQEQREQRAPA
jgi:hypothetical protein